MAFELEILVINQTKPSRIPFRSFIEVLNEIDDEGVSRYKDIWKLMSQTKGIWYSLVIEEDDVKSAYPICTSDFEIEPEKLPIPYWIDDEDVIYHLTPLVIFNEYLKDFEAIVTFLIKQSPMNTLMSLARYQAGDDEIIQGTISLGKFMDDLKNKRILFNVCYIITKD